mmetsp:Transcript_81111/g.233068  ORF Transcript_81111/g.233068 Transcript_81111/m.233068 type:complete len:264 (-) Transcript_81111:933-1724(-)
MPSRLAVPAAALRPTVRPATPMRPRRIIAENPKCRCRARRSRACRRGKDDHNSGLGAAGAKTLVNCCCCSLVSVFGKTISTLTYRWPKLEGSSLRGMPSPCILKTWKGFVTLVVPISTECPSKCRTVWDQPSKASRRPTCVLMCKSSPCRLNFTCLSCLRVSTTLPGSMPGFCSAILGKVTCSPSFMPFSMCTSMMVSSCLHFSLLWTSCCCCMNMPGPTCTCTVFSSLGHLEHPWHLGDCGRTRQPLQTIRRLMLALEVPPL